MASQLAFKVFPFFLREYCTEMFPWLHSNKLGPGDQHQSWSDCESRARGCIDGAEDLRAREARPAVVCGGRSVVLSLPTSAEVTDIAVRPTCSPRPA